MTVVVSSSFLAENARWLAFAVLCLMTLLAASMAELRARAASSRSRIRQLTQPIRMWPSFSALAARSSGSAATAVCVPAYAFRSVLITSSLRCGTPSDLASSSAISVLVAHSSRSLISTMDVCCMALAVATSPRTLSTSAPREGAFSTPFRSCSTRAPVTLRLMFWTLLPTDCCNAASALSIRRMSA
uniref:Secreted protein n=1 Tax=Trichogramma kaykai TaxID=54128 RepID=A0ABD2XQA0_9HYME